MITSHATASDALSLWHRVMLDNVRGDRPDLTARQITVLLTVYMEQGPHTVRRMASHLVVSKPAITRALDRLCELGLVRRKLDGDDRRSILIHRTVKGSVFLTDFGEEIQQVAGVLDDDE
jgi:DNA-binding MarR family transcriptional regulator